MNLAGVVWHWVGCLCEAAIARLGLFANVNLSATLPGAAVAVPPHNDRQDVFVLQARPHARARAR